MKNAYLESVDKDSLENQLRDLKRRVRALELKKVKVNSLDELATSFGLQVDGEIRCGNGVEPGSGFTGGRFGYPGFVYNGVLYFFVGVNNDVLMVGMDLATGKMTFGGGEGWLDADGMTLKANSSSMPVNTNLIKWMSGATTFASIGQVCRGPGATEKTLNIVAEYYTFNGDPLAAIDAGTWTPTPTNTTNISTSTAYEGQYIRVGNIVHCSVAIAITPTAAAACVLQFTPPVAPADNFADTYAGSGVGSIFSISLSGAIDSVAGVKKMRLRFLAPATTERVWRLTFSYKLE